MAALFAFLLVRAIGIYPVAFADEWVYSSYSRLRPLSDAGLPSYLYLLIFRSTRACGDGFLECARVLNSACMVLAMPFIYSVARRVCTPLTAAFLALATTGGAFSTYSIYFMPESMYFLVFWALTWMVLCPPTKSRRWHALAVGVMLGVLSLVKIHALFLAPAVLAYLAWDYGRAAEKGALREAALAVMLAGLALIVVKLGAGYLMAGRNGLTLLGSLYGSLANSTPMGHRLGLLVTAALNSAKGHLMALCLMFGPPMAALIAQLTPRNLLRSQPEDDACSLRIYSVLVLGILLVLATLFTASVEGSGPMDFPGRLHMRYYNFVFPLLAIVAAAELNQEGARSIGRGLVTTVVFLAAAGALAWKLPGFTPSMVDSPELRGFTLSPRLFLVLGIVGLVATALWWVDARRGAWLFLFVLTPLAAVVGIRLVGSEVRVRRTPDVYEDASRFAKRYLGPDDRP